MKRIVTLMLAAALTFAMAAPAVALDVNVKGDFTTAFVARDNLNFTDTDTDKLMAHNRFRSNIEFVASENLKGVVYFTTGNKRWGNAGDGAGVGTDGNDIKTRFAYVDWKIPSTDVNVRMGQQPIAFPAAVAGSPVFDSTGSGVTTSIKATDNVAVNFGWVRLSDDGGASAKDVGADMFFAAVPMNFDSVNVTPYGEFTRSYKNDAGLLGRIAGDSDMYHAGVAATIKPMDALAIRFDAIYGAVSNDVEANETKGFFVDAKVEYNVGMGVLGVLGWYATGNDEGDADGGQMPSLNNHNGDNWGFAPSSMGTYGNGPLTTGQFITKSGVGTWGAGLMFERASFVEKLSHDFRVLYYQGTNEAGSAARDFSGAAIPMTDDDSVIEINVDSRYEIYPGFNTFFQIGYMIPDFENDAQDENAWRVGLSFHYTY